jgi:hypothetical protein|tara:strand:- start:843 stop:1529 length:687 start_codon:yes stop_codon:yes gene_type:complete
MKNLIKILLFCFMSFTYAGNNDIYLTQSGGGDFTLLIDQIGNTNIIGTSGARVIMAGSSLDANFKQQGNSNTLAASILQGNASSWTMWQIGDSNTSTITAGGSGSVGSSDFDYTATGNSNVLTWLQGSSSAATGGNFDAALTGNSNDLNIRSEVIGAINNWDIDGNSNDIDVTQIGTDDKAITFTLVGDSNDIDIDQTTAASGVTDTISLVANSTSGSINIDQCASGC